MKKKAIKSIREGQTLSLLDGTVIKVSRIFPDAGKYEGNICDLIKYQKDGKTRIVERPLILE